MERGRPRTLDLRQKAADDEVAIYSITDAYDTNTLVWRRAKILLLLSGGYSYCDVINEFETCNVTVTTYSMRRLQQEYDKNGLRCLWAPSDFKRKSSTTFIVNILSTFIRRRPTDGRKWTYRSLAKELNISRTHLIRNLNRIDLKITSPETDWRNRLELLVNDDMQIV